MSKTSINLSDRIFFTIDFQNGTAYIGELDQTRNAEGKLEQKKLVTLTQNELMALTGICRRIGDVHSRRI